MDWLRTVGKIVVFELDGSIDIDDDGVSVYPQVVAVKIVAVIILKSAKQSHWYEIQITPIKLSGDDGIAPLESLQVQNGKVIVGVDVEVEGEIVGFDIKGRIVEVY